MLIAQVAVLVIGSLVPSVSASPTSPWVWPLADHRIDRRFDPPKDAYGPGHRGIDLPGRAGQEVRSVATGTVTFAAKVAGVWTITINHGTERSTYQPVKPTVEVGDAVAAGQAIGVLFGGHSSCRSICLNLGRIRGTEYLDPETLLGGANSYQLIDPDGAVPTPPAPQSGELPVAGPITSAFGMRIHPVTGMRKLHDGVDIGAACRTEVPAARAGKVTFSGPRGAYGQQVELLHADSSRTSYSHLSARTVTVGSSVSQGALVGLVGSTGSSTGCHLHFMKLVGGKPVDPLG